MRSRIGQSVGLSPVGHVSRDPFDAHAQSGGDPGRRRLQLILVPATDDYIRAGRRECAGHRGAETFAAACYLMRYALKDQIVCSASSILELNFRFQSAFGLPHLRFHRNRRPWRSESMVMHSTMFAAGQLPQARSARYGCECIPGHCAYGSAPRS
jgi:hypothetical protein